jgi:uncharacterized RDD family membrane protein YckC
VKCQFCSELIPDGDSFCGACGARAPGVPQVHDVALGDAPSAPVSDAWPETTGTVPDRSARRSTYFSGAEDPGTLQYVYAGFWMRVVAWLIDGAIAIGAALLCAVAVSLAFGGIYAIVVVIAFVLFYIPIAFTYFWIATAVGGGWGKRLCGLRIVAFDDGALPGYGAGFVRVLVTGAFGLLGGFIPVVGFLASLIDPLSMLWDERRQTYHDKVAGTVVIRV